VAGENAEDAIRVVAELNRRGILGSLDYLGENTVRTQDALSAGEEVRTTLRLIRQRGVRSNVSIKLSQMGLLLDIDLCRENLRAILQEAQNQGNFIRIDMEDSSLTDRTLEMYRWARQEGFTNVVVVLQSSLYRTSADVDDLAGLRTRVRLCKGAYREPGEIAYPAKKDVDVAYDRLTTRLIEVALEQGAPQIDAGGTCPPIPAIATHDERRIQHALDEAVRLKLPPGAMEFQMLYGIRRDLQDELAASGHPLRVYVPYGTHWYPYLMRRLAERPANMWFFLSNLVRR
jgi:proline dehydrogenase